MNQLGHITFSNWRQFQFEPTLPQPVSGGYMHPYGFLVGRGLCSAFVNDFSYPTRPDFFTLSDLNGFALSGMWSWRYEQKLQTVANAAMSQFSGRIRHTNMVVSRFSHPEFGVEVCDFAITDSMLIRQMHLTNRTPQPLQDVTLSLQNRSREMADVLAPSMTDDQCVCWQDDEHALFLYPSTGDLFEAADGIVHLHLNELAAFQSTELTLFLGCGIADADLASFRERIPRESIDAVRNREIARQTGQKLLCESENPDFNDALEAWQLPALALWDTLPFAPKTDWKTAFRQNDSAEIWNHFSPSEERLQALFALRSKNGSERWQELNDWLTRHATTHLSLQKMGVLLYLMSDGHHPIAPELIRSLNQPHFNQRLQTRLDLFWLWAGLWHYLSGFLHSTEFVEFNPHLPDECGLRIEGVQNRFTLERSYTRRHFQTSLCQADERVLTINQPARIRWHARKIDVSAQRVPIAELASHHSVEVQVDDKPQIRLHDQWLEGELRVWGVAIRWRMHGKLRKFRLKNESAETVHLRFNGTSHTLPPNGLLYFKLKRTSTKAQCVIWLRNQEGTPIEAPDLLLDPCLRIEGYALDRYGFPLSHVHCRYGAQRTVLSTDATGFFSHELVLSPNVRQLLVTGRRGLRFERVFEFQPDFWRRIGSFFERGQKTICRIVAPSAFKAHAVYLQAAIQRHTDIWLPISSPTESGDAENEIHFVDAATDNENPLANFDNVQILLKPEKSNGFRVHIISKAAPEADCAPFLTELGKWYPTFRRQ